MSNIEIVLNESVQVVLSGWHLFQHKSTYNYKISILLSPPRHFVNIVSISYRYRKSDIAASFMSVFWRSQRKGRGGFVLVRERSLVFNLRNFVKKPTNFRLSCVTSLCGDSPSSNAWWTHWVLNYDNHSKTDFLLPTFFAIPPPQTSPPVGASTRACNARSPDASSFRKSGYGPDFFCISG